MSRSVLTEQQVKIGEQQCKIFAVRFREARTKVGLTQRDVTKKTGITQSILSKVENGTQNLTIHRASVLADVVGVPLYQLFMPLP